VAGERACARRRAGRREALQLTASPARVTALQASYAVRGEVPTRAEQLQNRLRLDPQSLPFKDVVFCNIGNPQQLRQPPLTFFRQVLALTSYPPLLDDPNLAKSFPSDALERARTYLARIPGGSGAYSKSQGVDVVREEVAEFIRRRDGYEALSSDIFLTDGASPAVKLALQILLRDRSDGILIPIPQYPLYSATITLCGGSMAHYYLDEDNRWGLSISELERALRESQARGVHPRALVVINPGNPTGQCLPEKNMREIVEFCRRFRLVLLADEVYQSNVYGETPFTSFKKVVRSMGHEDFEMFSFHSVSKGFVGECGRRGGYMEVVGVEESVRAELLKLASVNLCSNLDGQIMTGLMCNPPRAGDPSFNMFENERVDILQSLQRRARRVADALNRLEGVVCNPVEGAMYAFPRISLPPKAVEAAAAAKTPPDTFYCLELLNNTGVCVVPGGGFLQRPGTLHFRTTILPPEEQMNDVLERMARFHMEFMTKYK
jgi:alanine transaminase